MAIRINSSFSVGAPLPIDDRLTLTKAQMLSINDNIMPDVYLAVCQDDGQLYLYNKANTSIENTGKFRLFTTSDNTQAEVMPTPTTTEPGTIMQYTGDTTEEFTRGYFYEAVENTETGDVIWQPINTQTPNSENSELPEAITPNVSVGGIEAGTTIDAGTPISDVLNQMLTAYTPPVLKATLNPETTIYKKGTSVSNLSIEIEVTKTSQPIQSIEVLQNDAPVEMINTDIASGGIVTYTSETPVTDTAVFLIKVNDGVQTVEQEITVSFINPYYYGAVGSVTSDIITTRKELLEAVGPKTLEFTSNNSYVVFAYDASYPDLKSITDLSGLENITSFTKAEMEINGIMYKVYSSETKITCQNFTYTFK